MSSMTSTLYTPGLRLPPLARSHADLFCALHTCPRVMTHIGAPLSPGAARERFERALRHQSAANGILRMRAVQDRGSGEPYGIGALKRTASTIELGLMLLPSAWRHWIARQAVPALVEEAFMQSDAQAVDVECRSGVNARAAGRIVRALGFERIESGSDTVRWRMTRNRFVHPAIGTRP